MISSLASCAAAILAPQYITNSIIGRARNIATYIIHTLDSALHNITCCICNCASESARRIQYATDRSVDCAKKSSSTSRVTLCHSSISIIEKLSRNQRAGRPPQNLPMISRISIMIHRPFGDSPL